jgi:hypothetical protein
MTVFAQYELRPTGNPVVLTVPSHRSWRITAIGFNSAPSNPPMGLSYKALNSAPNVNVQSFSAPNTSVFAACIGAVENDPNGTGTVMFRLADIRLPGGSEINVGPEQPNTGFNAVFVIEED